VFASVVATCNLLLKFLNRFSVFPGLGIITYEYDTLLRCYEFIHAHSTFIYLAAWHACPAGYMFSFRNNPLKQIISGFAGPIFTKISGYGRY